MKNQICLSLNPLRFLAICEENPFYISYITKNFQTNSNMNNFKIASYFSLITFFLFFACTEKQDTRPPDDTIIEVNEEGVFLNSVKVEDGFNANDIKARFGNPNKEFIQKISESDDGEEDSFADPNNMYTYDDKGILIYEFPKRKVINIILINFSKKSRYDVYPKYPFIGSLLLNGVQIDYNTSLDSLRKIPGLEIEDNNTDFYKAKLNGVEFYIAYKGKGANSKLADISIYLNRTKEIPNEYGWIDSEIKQFKAILNGEPSLDQLSNEYGFDKHVFIDCYFEKYMAEFRFDFSEDRTPEQQNYIETIMGECMELGQKE